MGEFRVDDGDRQVERDLRGNLRVQFGRAGERTGIVDLAADLSANRRRQLDAGADGVIQLQLGGDRDTDFRRQAQFAGEPGIGARRALAFVAADVGVSLELDVAVSLMPCTGLGLHLDVLRPADLACDLDGRLQRDVGLGGDVDGHDADHEGLALLQLADLHRVAPCKRGRAFDADFAFQGRAALGLEIGDVVERVPIPMHVDLQTECVLMLLYIVKGFGVLVWLVRGGDGLDPEGGATFEFGQVAGAAFDLADAAGVDAEGVADLLLGDAVRDA